MDKEIKEQEKFKVNNGDYCATINGKLYKFETWSEREKFLKELKDEENE